MIITIIMIIQCSLCAQSNQIGKFIQLNNLLKKLLRGTQHLEYHIWFV